ncbi:uncharacterized protein LOC116851397 [Odontomachus brunneus]|uniref:uncharacterized protein LOC116851397 n=1 Tax=Odontomachus brunneus TaxID=486640 RepID=UPI0013F245BA|nr:uncharacterized protein LOC116851397 [Odontomachus brunneus]
MPEEFHVKDKEKNDTVEVMSVNNDEAVNKRKSTVSEGVFERFVTDKKILLLGEDEEESDSIMVKRRKMGSFKNSERSTSEGSDQISRRRSKEDELKQTGVRDDKNKQTKRRHVKEKINKSDREVEETLGNEESFKIMELDNEDQEGFCVVQRKKSSMAFEKMVKLQTTTVSSAPIFGA